MPPRDVRPSLPRDEATLTADSLPAPKVPVSPETLTADSLPAPKGPVAATGPVDLHDRPTLTADAAVREVARKVTVEETAPSSLGLPPSLYARFEQFEVAGRGGMGTVYKARDLRLGRAVAIKLLFHQDSKGGLLKEARAQARLRHPNVCEVFEAGVADQVPFIVMRYVEGAPLQKAADDMSLEEKVAAVRDVAFALHEAHRTGLIHRDVKPGNILVERTEDGRIHPLITDFGIARDLSDSKATMADSVQGTPAFMAPEQAAGQTRSIDRRTDVYGLGATLYDLLAGRPPIVGDTVIALLRNVIEVEATPIRQLVSTIPLDLEAIVMKCLEKDPAGRFESARALAEDLQRFLDGDLVLARRSSWGARLFKRAKKHRGKVAVGTLALAGALTLTGLWVRERRIADERAAAAQELGGITRELELFMRIAHMRPLHDLTRESDTVRGGLKDIESRIAVKGSIARGPGEEALGRGYLALQQPSIALQHFERALAEGEPAAGFQYVMGLAHVALYREALSKANRIQNETERKAYLAEIEKAHKIPAMTSLRAALAQGVRSPAYAEGLIALAEGRLEDALAKAEEAFQAAPWLYEAKKLTGDVLFAMGSQTGHDKAFDAARTRGLFDRAAKAYEEAADIGRSDPAVHEAECDLWIQAMYTADKAGESMGPAFEKAKASCGRAITASPASTSGRVLLAMAHNGYSFWAVFGHSGGSPEQTLSEAATLVDDAVSRSPGDAFASYLKGAIWRTHALYDQEIGRDHGDAIERSIQGYEGALAVDPRFAWALNEECGTLGLRGQREARLGIDPTATFDKALSLCERAIAVDPRFLFPRGNIQYVRSLDAERLVLQGKSPQAIIDAALTAANDAEKASPEWGWLPFWRVTFHLAGSEYAMSNGGDPWPSVRRAQEIAAKRPAFAEAADDIDGRIALAEAEARLAALLKKGAPFPPDAELTTALTKAREKLKKASEPVPWDWGYAVLRARVELAELRYRTALGDATEAHAEAALAPIGALLSGDRVDPVLFEMGARVREARAELLILRRKDARAELASCTALAEKAAQQGPGLPNGLATLGRCRVALSHNTSRGGPPR